jgi:hypothetical protein
MNMKCLTYQFVIIGEITLKFKITNLPNQKFRSKVVLVKNYIFSNMKIKTAKLIIFLEF